MAWNGPRTHRALGVGLNTQDQPVCAVDFLVRQRLTGRVFVAGNYATYLLFRAWPAVRVNMDTRDYLYTDQDHRRDLWPAMDTPAGLQAYFQRFPTDFLLLKPRDLRVEHYTMLLEALGWVFVYLDDKGFLMAAPRLESASLIQREGYRHILPWVNKDVTATNAVAVLTEADRALQHCPEGATFAWAYKAEALRLLGRYAESQTAARQVPKQLILDRGIWH
jgi:hypothetical protein